MVRMAICVWKPELSKPV